MTTDPPTRTRLQRWFAPTWAERKRALYRQSQLLVALAWLAIAFAYFYPVDLRNTGRLHVALAWAAFMFWTLSLHVGLLLTLVALIAAWAKKRRLALAAALPALLLAGPTALSYIPTDRVIKTDNELTVMSVNLLMINRETQPIIDEIIAADPDVLLLQEYTTHWRDALDAALADRYPHVVGIPQPDSFGAALYSKHPFVEDPVTKLPMGRHKLPQMRIVIDHAGEQVAIYNVHLLPPRTLAYTTEHRVQLADLCDRLREEELPFVIAGDFNFTDATRHADAIRATGVHDALDGLGAGLAASWPVHGFMRYLPLPGLRIDHVYCSNRWQTIAAGNGFGQGSDHRPLIVRLTLINAQVR